MATRSRTSQSLQDRMIDLVCRVINRSEDVLWEIYNEPNAFWQPHPNTDDYIKLALATSEDIAEAAPGEKVVGPAC